MWGVLRGASNCAWSSGREISTIAYARQIQEVQLVDLAARRAAHTDRQIHMGVYAFAITTTSPSPALPL